MLCELRKPIDYPLGLYLGPSRLTASYYNEDDQAISTLASVSASPAWRNFTEDLVRGHGRWGPDCENSIVCSDAITALFADAMAAILDASKSALGHAPVIGYVILPKNTSAFAGLFDIELHYNFPCYQWARHGDYIEYDIFKPTKAVHYAYRLPWGRNEDKNNEVEENFVLLANLELGYFELTGVCLEDFCTTSDLAARAWPELGEDALWPAMHLESNVTSDDRASPSAHFSQAVRLLADAVAAYMAPMVPTDPDRSCNFHGVVVAGAASEQAMAALRLALHDALPYANDSQFYDTVDAASVFSFGAAVLGHNTQLADEYVDCDCREDEELRRQHGGPLNDEFPCNRPMA